MFEKGAKYTKKAKCRKASPKTPQNSPPGTHAPLQPGQHGSTKTLTKTLKTPPVILDPPKRRQITPRAKFQDYPSPDCSPWKASGVIPMNPLAHIGWFRVMHFLLSMVLCYLAMCGSPVRKDTRPPQTHTTDPAFLSRGIRAVVRPQLSKLAPAP